MNVITDADLVVMKFLWMLRTSLKTDAGLKNSSLKNLTGPELDPTKLLAGFLLQEKILAARIQDINHYYK